MQVCVLEYVKKQELPIKRFSRIDFLQMFPYLWETYLGRVTSIHLFN